MAPGPSMAGTTQARCLPVMPTQAVPDGRLDRARNPYGSPRKSLSFLRWDREFESPFLQGRVNNEPCGCWKSSGSPARTQRRPDDMRGRRNRWGTCSMDIPMPPGEAKAAGLEGQRHPFELFQSTGDPGGAEVAGMTIPEHGHIRIPVQTAPMG